MTELVNPNKYIDSILKGSAAPVEKQPQIIVSDDESPSAIGGLVALGASVIGATALGRRIPAIRNLFTRDPVPATIKPIIEVSKPTVTGNLPTATGQASELITQSRALTIPKSKYNEVADIPFTQGKGYNPLGENALIGHASYDRLLEAPFEKAPAKEWIKWLSDADSGQLRVTGGPLAGVSRQVQKEELADLNLLNMRGKEVEGGFLKLADEEGLEIDRNTLLNFVRNSPLNKIKSITKFAPGSAVEDFSGLVNQLKPIEKTLESLGTGASQEAIDSFALIRSNLNDFTRKGITSREGLSQQNLQEIQRAIVQLGTDHPELSEQTGKFLVNFNRITGTYNNRVNGLDTSNIKNIQIKDNGLPRHKQALSGQYDILGGENFTEKVYVFDGKIPNVLDDSFKFVGADGHYGINPNKELFFIRYDDLPNLKLGGRHLRVSEAQSDLNAAATSSNPEKREMFFKNRINPFNTSGAFEIYKKQMNEIKDKIRPFSEVGRGSAAFTKQQVQDLNRYNYELKQLEKSALRSILDKGNLDSTTYAPLAGSYNDYMIKDLLRTMAKRNINHISIVPAAMNQNVKGFTATKFGNEMNYGLMNGKKMSAEVKKIRDAYMPNTTGMTQEQRRGVRKVPAQYEKTGRMIPSSQYSILNESLNKIAKEYGAKFELQPMPKSNPNKEYKVVQIFNSDRDENYARAVREGRAHYTAKRKNSYLYEDHLAAADTEEQANLILKAFSQRGTQAGVLKIDRLSPDSPKNYEMVPTLTATNDVLKKFMLPFKAYMYEGGFVDKTNIFKSIL
jgi:hypothetical protein